MTIVRFIILRGLLKIQIKNAYVEKLNKIVLIWCLPLISQNTKMSLLCICVSYIFITNSWFSHIIFIWHLTISSRWNDWKFYWALHLIELIIYSKINKRFFCSIIISVETEPKNLRRKLLFFLLTANEAKYTNDTFWKGNT